MATAAVAGALALKPPEPLSFEGNVAENWKRWIKKFNNYMSAIECDTKSDKVKVAILEHAIGDEAVDKMETFNLTEAQRRKYDDIVAALKSHCVPKKNESISRHLFLQRSQKKGESFEQFLTELKKLSVDCEFGNLKDSLIKDRIISGIQSKTLKNRLLREDDSKLDRCVTLCKAAELADQQLKTLNPDVPEQVNYVIGDQRDTRYQRQPSRKEEPQQSRGNFKPRNWTGKQHETHGSGKPEGQQRQGETQTCSKCGYSHQYGRCPAYNKTCNNCKKLHHFAQVCRGKKYNLDAIDAVRD